MQDKLSKKRLQRRRFCFVRHPAYKELIEPEEKTCSSYLDPKRKEFWRTDVDTVLKREMKADKDRYKVLTYNLSPFLTISDHLYSHKQDLK